MPSRPDRLRREAAWLATRARDVTRLERELFTAAELPRGERARVALARYRAIAADRRELEWLGAPLRYDSRLLPALLPSYLQEIRRLDQLIGLASATVVDVGANVGQFAATLVRRFPGARIWSFEPGRRIFDLLEANTRHAPAWSAYPWGIAEQDGVAELWSVPERSAQASVYRENAVQGLLQTEAVNESADFRRLSPELAGELGIPAEVDLLKIDVEGAEASALRGMAGVRWRNLSIELQTDRHGEVSRDGLPRLLREIWGIPAVEIVSLRGGAEVLVRPAAA